MIAKFPRARQGEVKSRENTGFQGVAEFPSETAAKSIGVIVITKPGFMVIMK